MANRELSEVFGGVWQLTGVITDDANRAQARARVADLAEYLDVDLDEAPTERASTKWTTEKLAAWVMETCWNSGRHEFALRWYLVTGLLFQMTNGEPAALETKRAIEHCRRWARDMAATRHDDILMPGAFADWWLEPLTTTPAVVVDDARAAAALEVLANIGESGATVKRKFASKRIANLEALAGLRDGDWLDVLLTSAPSIGPRLVDIIATGNRCNATIAGAVLYKVARKQHSRLPLDLIAIPLLDLYQEAATGSRKWISTKFMIPPQGDLWEWVESHIVAYGKRLEPVLVQRMRAKVASRRVPADLYVLAAIAMDHELNEHTYSYLHELVEQIIASPDEFRGWWRLELLDEVFKAQAGKHRPSTWPELVAALA